MKAPWSSAHVSFSACLSVYIWLPVLDPKLLDPVGRQAAPVKPEAAQAGGGRRGREAAAPTPI